MRVVILTTSFPIREGSSSGVFVQRLVRNLPATIDVTVITPSDTSAVGLFEETNYKLSCFRYAPRKWQVLAHQPGGIPVALKKNKLLRLLLPIFLVSMFVACLRAARKSDITHANWSINGAIAGLVGFILRKPVVTTVRGEDITRAKTSKIYRYILVLCLCTNYKVVTVSEAIRDMLIYEFPRYRNKIAFLPNGVDAALFDCPEPEKKYHEKTVFKLVAIGSLIPRKGIDVIIEAFDRLPNQQDFELIIIGDGPEREHLVSLARSKGLTERVKFIGHVSPQNVPDYLCSANVLVLASYSEGRPNVVLESLAAGVPVIASDIEGVQELVQDGETGFRFQPGDARSLAEIIEKLQRSQELQVKFSQRGRDFILKNRLIWADVGHSYAQLYKDAMRY